MEHTRAELAKAFGDVLPHFKEVARIEKEIQDCKENIEKSTNNPIREYKMGFWIFTIMLSSVPILLLIQRNYKMAIEVSAFILILILICAAFLISALLRNKYQKEKAEQCKKTIENDKNKYADELKSLEGTLSIVPPNYRYEIAVDYMYNCFINQRADSIKEAVNLFEEQQHRWKMENAAEQSVELQRQQASYLNSIKSLTVTNTAINVVDAFSHLF